MGTIMVEPERYVTMKEVEELLSRAMIERDRYWKAQLDQVEMRLRVVEEAARRPPAPLPIQPISAKRNTKSSGKRCFICDGGTAVHRHRDLGIPLDDKCRKQVETYKQGGTITERRALWSQKLRQILPNARARDMLVFLEGQFAGSSQCTGHGAKSRKRKCLDLPAHNGGDCKPEFPDEAQCTICQDSLHCTHGSGGPKATTTLPCSHTFHRDCVIPWLQEKPSCPMCRHPAKIEYGADGSVRAVPGPALSIECTPCGSSAPCVVSPPLAGCTPSGCASSSCADGALPASCGAPATHLGRSASEVALGDFDVGSALSDLDQTVFQGGAASPFVGDAGIDVDMMDLGMLLDDKRCEPPREGGPCLAFLAGPEQAGGCAS